MRTFALTNPPQHGAELKPLQKALKAAKFYDGPVDGVFGAATGKACKRAKWHLGYPLKACVETGGQTLLDYLTGTMGLPLPFRVRRHQRGFGRTPKERVREQIVSWALKGVASTAQIHYAQIRPIPHTWRLPMTTDCSGFVTLCYQLAGAPDPNGQRYSGQGWTGTLLDHGISVPLSKAQTGDLVIWGANPGHHVAVIVAPGGDPEIVSHGSEAGPIKETVSGETRAQARPYVIHRYPLR